MLSPDFGADMRRREFITLLGGAALAWPLAVLAQPPNALTVGFLNSRSPGEATYLLAAFREGLPEAGFVEGRNVAVEYRWAEGQYQRLPQLAAELVQARVAAIAATGGAVSGLAAKAATSTIPVIFTTDDDPIETGLVSSLNRPTGNLTGVAVLSNLLGAKRLELLHQVVPTAEGIAVLFNPTYPSTKAQLSDVKRSDRCLQI
jgi:putative tryptophan/tyrosine transport system substrate-binding protein